MKTVFESSETLHSCGSAMKVPWLCSTSSSSLVLYYCHLLVIFSSYSVQFEKHQNLFFSRSWSLFSPVLCDFLYNNSHYRIISVLIIFYTLHFHWFSETQKYLASQITHISCKQHENNPCASSIHTLSLPPTIKCSVSFQNAFE